MFENFEEFLRLRKPNTARAYRQMVKDLCNFLGVEYGTPKAEKAFLTLSAALATRYVNSMIAKKLATSAIKQRIAIGSALFKYFQSLGLVEADIFQAVKHLTLPQRKTRPNRALLPEEVQRLMHAPNLWTERGFRDATIMAVLFGSGLRRSELCGLRIQDVKDDGNRIYFILHATKSGKDHNQPFPIELHDILRRWIDHRLKQGSELSAPLFPSHFGTHISPHRVNDILKEYARKIGLSGRFSSHCCRHTVITHLHRKGVSIDELKQFSRHANYESLDIYIEREKEKNSSVADKISYFSDPKKGANE